MKEDKAGAQFWNEGALVFYKLRILSLFSLVWWLLIGDDLMFLDFEILVVPL